MSPFPNFVLNSYRNVNECYSIRKDNSICGIGTSDKTKISLFADDSLLSIDNPLRVMDGVKLHLAEFGEITGLQVNWRK